MRPDGYGSTVGLQEAPLCVCVCTSATCRLPVLTHTHTPTRTHTHTYTYTHTHTHTRTHAHTHLHSSLEGVAPTEVGCLLSFSEALANSACSCSVHLRLHNLASQTASQPSTTVFVGQWRVDGSLPLCNLKAKIRGRRRRRKKGKNANESSLLSEGDSHTSIPNVTLRAFKSTSHARTCTHVYIHNMFLHMYMHIYVNMYTHICISPSIYIYLYICSTLHLCLSIRA